MHRTVLRHEKIALQRCQSCCSDYHCPFCGPKVFKPTMERHVATVVHCCLSLICHLAGQKGLDVLAADSYVLACWNPPHCVDF
ncbi:hypothetical protein G5714_005070 [Onychostoma macrolepis]|uniref:Uncharacterized protein n=1 Tax=Onychostoma macrolepis TaxID=369639 RepID=A0A7J6D6F2_9TELE|nr:hypothetical protein G5714_005070 [Onychostoma macrolepis]